MSEKVIYTVGGTVQASGGIYISREADEELLQLCRAGKFCYVLTARQMGKSSLMVATRERLDAENIRSVEIDLTKMGSELSGLTAEQWYLGLIDLIVDQLDLDVNYVAWWDQRARLGPTQRLSQFLRQVVLEQVAEPVVIFIDEIESTLNLDFTGDFFAAIRACYNARASDQAFTRLSFVLLGVATPSDLISDPQRTPFNIGLRVDLTDFTNREAIPLADGLGLPLVEAGQVLIWTLDWTGGHPYLTQRLCVAAAASPTKDWDAAAVNELVEKTFLGEQSDQDSNLRFVRDMLTEHAPDKAAVLKTYRRIHAGQAVPDEERSLVKTHLKLSGIVKRKGDNLVVRNRIYEWVFNQEWIGQKMPRDWARQIGVVSIILVLLLGGLFGYYTYRQGQQTAEARAQAFIDSFRGTTSADVRITSLANLFLLPGYEGQARMLFFEELTPEAQVRLFERADPGTVGKALIKVVQGLYTNLEDTEQNNRILEAMAKTLQEVDHMQAADLATEIELWLQGRSYYAEGKHEEAIAMYDDAIRLNEANPGTHFDRGLAYAGHGEPRQTLVDFEIVLRLDDRRQEQMSRVIEGDGKLYDAWQQEKEKYPSLAALSPTPPTSTPTPTATPTPSPTWTPTNTPTRTPTSTSIPTHTPTSTPRPTHTPTSTPMPTHTPTSTPRPTHTSTSTPTPKIILNCDLFDVGKLKHGESVRIELEVEGETYFDWGEYDIEWTANRGTFDPPNGPYTYYTPDGPGRVNVSVTVGIGDDVREFSCGFTIPSIIPHIEYFTVSAPPKGGAEVVWGVEGEFTSITIYCDGPSYCPDDGPLFSTEDPYGSVKVPKETGTGTFVLQVCNGDYCDTATTVITVH